MSRLRALLRPGAAALALAACSGGADRDDAEDEVEGTAGDEAEAAASSTGNGNTSTGADDGATTAGGSSSAGGTDDTGSAATATWHHDIGPIVAQKCGGCHVSGGIGPFSLATYAEAYPFAALLLDAVERRAMPPFLADSTEECEPRFGFKNDPRLTDGELALLRNWVDEGAPEGDPKTAAPLPTPPDLQLKDADIHLKIPGAVTIEGDKDKYLCFSIDPGFSDDTWIDGLQIAPGNTGVVHHVIVYVDPDRASEQLMGPDGSYPCFGGPGLKNTSLIGAWAPGALPFLPPEQVALRVAAGSRIVLNVHYHPTGAVEQDIGTTLNLRRFVGVPAFVGLVALIGNVKNAAEGLLPGPNDPDGVPVFHIPAGVVGHTEEMQLAVTEDLPELRIFGSTAHMHYVGTDMLIRIDRANPGADVLPHECLLQTPRWDFQWQQLYSYAADIDDLPRVHPGDKVSLRCTYNNSLTNPFVVKALAEQGLDQPQDVNLGEATLDEMCLGVFGVAVALKDAI